MVITDTSLCLCLHIRAAHGEDEGCHCGCPRFAVVSRRGTHTYQPGTPTVSRRVDRLAVGDCVLVGFPGRIVCEPVPGDRDDCRLTRRVADTVLRPVRTKRGALLGRVLSCSEQREVVGGYADYPGVTRVVHVVHTDLGDLPPLPAPTRVLVVA